MSFLEQAAVPEVCLKSGLSTKLITMIWIYFSCHSDFQSQTCETLLSPHSSLSSAKVRPRSYPGVNSHTQTCVSWKQIEGFSRTSEGNAEKDLDFKEALGGFSRRCRSFICEEVRCIPFESIKSSNNFKRCLFAFSNTRKYIAVCEFFSQPMVSSKAKETSKVIVHMHTKKVEEKIKRTKTTGSIVAKVVKGKQRDLEEWEESGLYQIRELLWQTRSTTNESKGHIPQEITLADFLSGTPSPPQIKVQRGCRPREQSCF